MINILLFGALGLELGAVGLNITNPMYWVILLTVVFIRLDL
jgi:hypothetical protein